MDTNAMIRLLSLGFNIISSAFVIVIFCVVKFNDLVHIDKRLEGVESELKKTNENLSELTSVVSGIDGYIKGKDSK